MPSNRRKAQHSSVMGSVRLAALRRSGAGATHRPPAMNQAAQGKDMDSAHLDFSRAFGTVPQKILTGPLSQVKRLRTAASGQPGRENAQEGSHCCTSIPGRRMQDRPGSFPAAVGENQWAQTELSLSLRIPQNPFEAGQALAQAAQKGCGVSILGDIKKMVAGGF
ncbi:hypothetical protein HGM15179_010038 [Zosterops borbonicus]|uniref:Uncharacterized protein n=1 Tax=Zosterops borbonicus TaxID=364589 RepID=A0A8K1GFA9_9PASS|nr:hypothetical protein HGM15179_010038 [Zosterops borbonicus]